MSRLPISAIPLLLLTTFPAFPQPTRLGPSCDLRILGATETASFLAFDRELRAALSRPDPAMLSLLVQFPLRINEGPVNLSIENPASLQARFDALFPLSLRDTVRNQRPETLSCSYSGIMYGHGELWVNPISSPRTRYLIQTVNLPAAPTRTPTQPQLEFACRTTQLRLIIDLPQSTSSATPRLRAWKTPHSLLDPPDLNLANGQKNFEGTGPCSHAIWTFSSGSTIYELSELGCTEGLPPAGAHAQLSITVPAKPAAMHWCF